MLGDNGLDDIGKPLAVGPVEQLPEALPSHETCLAHRGDGVTADRGPVDSETHECAIKIVHHRVVSDCHRHRRTKSTFDTHSALVDEFDIEKLLDSNNDTATDAGLDGPSLFEREQITLVGFEFVGEFT